MEIEKIRANIRLIGKAVDELDALEGNRIAARWQYEMVSRMPELGEHINPRTMQPNRFEAADLAANILDLEREESTAVSVLLHLTGADSEDEARGVYLELMSAYQRYGALRELHRMIPAGHPEVLKELTETFGTIEALNDAISTAKQYLETVYGGVAQTDIPPHYRSKIAVPTSGLTLS